MGGLSELLGVLIVRELQYAGCLYLVYTNSKSYDNSNVVGFTASINLIV